MISIEIEGPITEEIILSIKKDPQGEFRKQYVSIQKYYHWYLSRHTPENLATLYDFIHRKWPMSKYSKYTNKLVLTYRGEYERRCALLREDPIYATYKRKVDDLYITKKAQIQDPETPEAQEFRSLLSLVSGRSTAILLAEHPEQLIREAKEDTTLLASLRDYY